MKYCNENPILVHEIKILFFGLGTMFGVYFYLLWAYTKPTLIVSVLLTIMKD